MSGSTALMEPISETILAKYVRFLVGSFRMNDADDGEVMTRGLTALLGSYPEFVVRAVCDPRSGLPAKSKFFPTLYEVRSACEAKMRPTLEAERRRRIQAENIADRPAEIDEAAAALRKEVVAKWRETQAMQEAARAGIETPLEALDARKLHGEHKALVAAAIDARLARLAEASKVTPLRLSPAALATLDRGGMRDSGDVA